MNIVNCLITNGFRLAVLLLAFLASACVPVQKVTSDQWVDLFDGRSLTGWKADFTRLGGEGQDPAKLFKVSNGIIHVYQGQKHGSLQPYAVITTEQTFSSYRLSLEYKWGVNKFEPRVRKIRDAGLLYHAGPLNRKRGWPESVESQIQECEVGDTYTIATMIESTMAPNSIIYDEQGSAINVGERDGIKRVQHSQMYEKDGWNVVEVIVRGTQAVHLVNGKINNRVRNIRHWDDKKNTWTNLDSGSISLQAEGAEIFYRNIRIRPINELDPI
jgi:3-keto-disaccharide hydrolase